MGACRRATELISLSMDRPLSRWETVCLLQHTVLCRVCRVYRRQLGLVRAAMRSSEPELAGDALPDEARDRIRAALRAST